MSYGIIMPMEETQVLVTAEGLEALQAELAEMEGPKRRDIAELIKHAREEGDLSENQEYKQNKEDQAMLETRIQLLRNKIHNAVVVEKAEDVQEVTFGATVEIEDPNGKKISYTIVSSHEKDVASGKLSVDSPVAKALQGHRVGDKVTVKLPRGETSYTVLAIS